MMNNEGWIDITEYAVKYRVSQSTLRRRIRSNTIAYRMDRGKYLLADTPEALNKAPLFSRQQYTRPIQQAIRPQSNWTDAPVAAIQQKVTNYPTQTHDAELQRLQIENKALRERLAEAETLVKVLEAELQSYNS